MSTEPEMEGTRPKDPPSSSETKGRGGLVGFVASDHRYVFLGTSALALVGLALANQPHSASSFLARSYAVEVVLYYVLVAWIVVSLVALVNKLAKWRGDEYAKTSSFKRPQAVRAERICSYVVWAIVATFVVDRVVVGAADLVSSSIAQSKNPTDFFSSAVYMIYSMRDEFATGIVNTVILAVVGTVIAFFLAILLVFLRLQTIERTDDDFVRLLKTVGSGFARVYSAVVRGTPMMVQGLIIYYGGTSLLTARGMSATQILGVWPPFTAAMVTIALNSTAYMMEVLRSGIGAVDPGQAEAARSLGLSQWQAMRSVVFPQGILNAVPALSNELVINIKDSSVLMVIGVVELMFASRTITGVYYKQLPVYVVTAVCYLVLTMLATKLLNVLAVRLGAKPSDGVTSSN